MEKIKDWLLVHEPIIREIISALIFMLCGANLAISIISLVMK